VRGWPWSWWGGGVHSVVPLLRLWVVQPLWLMWRLWGPQARVSSSMLVWPPLAQSVMWCGSPEIVEGFLCRFRLGPGFPDFVVDG